jgi:hypothetical protein
MRPLPAQAQSRLTRRRDQNPAFAATKIRIFGDREA